MRSYMLALMAVLASSFCEPQRAAAQVMAVGGRTQGMFGGRSLGQSLGAGTLGVFGNHVLGQPFQPPAGNFSNYVPYASAGTFMNFGSPYGSVSVTGQPFFPPPVASVAMPIAAPPGGYNLYAPTHARASDPRRPCRPPLNRLPETNGETEGAAPTAAPADPPTMAPVIGRAIIAVAAPQAGGTFANAGPFARSAELSDRLTRIARAKGMLAGSGLNVYLGNHVALLQGEVRSPGDRTLLANVIGLEPEVRLIDNQLVPAAGSGGVSSNPSDRLSR